MIILAKHEEKQGLAKIESVCACAFEAVLGAFYLDGKLEQLKPFLEKVLTPYIEAVDANFEKYNAKALLQSVDKQTPVYKLVEETGPAHNRTFKVSVSYQNKVVAFGIGKSKKEAEQHAAYEACQILGALK